LLGPVVGEHSAALALIVRRYQLSVVAGHVLRQRYESGTVLPDDVVCTQSQSQFYPSVGQLNHFSFDSPSLCQYDYITFPLHCYNPVDFNMVSLIWATTSLKNFSRIRLDA